MLGQERSRRRAYRGVAGLGPILRIEHLEIEVEAITAEDWEAVGTQAALEFVINRSR